MSAAAWLVALDDAFTVRRIHGTVGGRRAAAGSVAMGAAALQQARGIAVCLACHVGTAWRHAVEEMMQERYPDCMSRRHVFGGQPWRVSQGAIEPRVAQECMAHVATQRGLVECPPHRHPPCAPPVAPLRYGHGGRPQLPLRRGTAQAPHRKEGHPGGRTREEQRPTRCTCLVRRGPPASPLVASWPWPHHTWMLVRSS